MKKDLPIQLLRTFLIPFTLEGTPSLPVSPLLRRGKVEKFETDFFGDLHCSSRFTGMLCDAQAQYGDYSELEKFPMWGMWEKEVLDELDKVKEMQ